MLKFARPKIRMMEQHTTHKRERIRAVDMRLNNKEVATLSHHVRRAEYRLSFSHTHQLPEVAFDIRPAKPFVDCRG